MKKNDIINYIVKNDLHSRFTISIIKKLATSGITKKDNSTSFALCDSYLEIVNGGYTDLIVEDLKHEVFIELMQLVNTGNVELKNDELFFHSYIDKNGNVKSYYINLFHVIRNYMNAQKKHIDRSAICIDLFNENNEEIIVSTKNKDYRRLLANETCDNSLENVAGRKDIQDIFAYLKFKYPKHYSLMCKVFELLYNGHTYDEISDILKITKNKVRYQISLMRSVFDETTLEIKYDRNYTTSLFSDVTRNKCTTYYINREIRKSTTATIKKVSLNVTTYPSCPLSCGILDEKTKEYIEETISNRKNETIKNSTSYINTYDRKNNTINVINQNGDTIFVIDCKNVPSKKTLKKHKITII